MANEGDVSPDIVQAPAKKRPGRKPKKKTEPEATPTLTEEIDGQQTIKEETIESATADETNQNPTEQPIKKKRGRPRKNPIKEETAGVPQPSQSLDSPSVLGDKPAPKKRGRKPKNQQAQPTAEIPESKVESVNLRFESLEIKTENIPLEKHEEKPLELLQIPKQEFGATNEVVESIFDRSSSSNFNLSGLFGDVDKKPGFIPGLDLIGDEEVNTGFFSSTPKLISPPKKSYKEKAAAEERLKEEKDKEAEEEDSNKIRRSSRIKTLEEKWSGRRRREVVFNKTCPSRSTSHYDEDSESNSPATTPVGPLSASSSPTRDSRDSFDSSNENSMSSYSSSFSSFPSSNVSSWKPLKVKSRWRDSLDAESLKALDSSNNCGDLVSDAAPTSLLPQLPLPIMPNLHLVKRPGHILFDSRDGELIEKLKKFEGIDENLFRMERRISKESRGMVCDCFLSREEMARGEVGCGEDCLNRLLMVECGSRCPTGEGCTNKKFERREYAQLEIFQTEKKGHGLRTKRRLPEGSFVIEYVGEVLDGREFRHRTKEYAKSQQEHFYFMALKSDSIIDATQRGNCSRFINHSCDPNCETQKWTVNGELRIGFFTIRELEPDDEITFDYQFQRYGKQAQRCYCGVSNCRGWIGGDEDDENRDPYEYTDKPKARVEKKKIDMDMAKSNESQSNGKSLIPDSPDSSDRIKFEEEMKALERVGLKNQKHTLSLCRLMVRADDWGTRERLLKILINGEEPCRRLFLDYPGLRILWTWMVELPLPVTSSTKQLILNDYYHHLFLEALGLLKIPTKNMIQDTKVLNIVEKWASCPSTTTCKTEKPVPALPEIPKEIKTEKEPTLNEVVPKTEDPDEASALSLAETPEIVKQELTQPTLPLQVDEIEDIDEVSTWTFVDEARKILGSWADLKEVFKIPKKERVEQMKEHEREADKSYSSSDDYNSSYEKTSGSKYSRISRVERRVSTGEQKRYEGRMTRFSNQPRQHDNISKEERRLIFEAKVARIEEEAKIRQQNDEVAAMHIERCLAVGLDPKTTPLVDESGSYYLDPATIVWKPIDIKDYSVPAECFTLLELLASRLKCQEEAYVVAEPEDLFGEWPPGLPPPPPLPPAVLPHGWKMSVDEEGQCYYYHVALRIPQWNAPDLELVLSDSDSFEEDDEIEIDEDDAQQDVMNPLTPTFRKTAKSCERRNKRTLSGLVQERIISPRVEEEGPSQKELIRARKQELLLKKLKGELDDCDGPDGENGDEVPLSESDAPIASSSHSLLSKSEVPLVKKRKKVERKQKPRRQKEKPSPGFKGLAQILGIPIPTGEEVPEGEKIPGLGDPPPHHQKISLKRPSRNPDSKTKRAKHKKHRNLSASSSQEKIPGLSIELLGPSDPALDTEKERQKRKTAEAIKEKFRTEIANVIVANLNPYRKPDCTDGKIVSTEDFKHVARKIAHAIQQKEIKHCKDVKNLVVNESVKHKTREFVRKFMGKFKGRNYTRDSEESNIFNFNSDGQL